MEQVVVRVSAEFIDVVADILRASGAWAVEERPSPVGAADTTELLAPLGGPFDAGALAALNRIAGIDPGATWKWEPVDDGVLHTWREFADVRAIADGWSVVPAWRDDLVRRANPHRSILIEPGPVFGMGDHPTTVSMLRAISRTCRGAGGTIRTMVDAGCGTGILAVFAAKAHGVESRCFDIAPDAPEIAIANARGNDVERLVSVVAGHGHIGDGWSDLVVANIGASALISLAPVFRRVSSASASVILGGIRDHQVDTVVDAYGTCVVTSVEQSGGWSTVVLRWSELQGSPGVDRSR